jgi:PleD family two-component response regulator
MTAAELLRTADRALYLAKKTGKEPALGRPADVA